MNEVPIASLERFRDVPDILGACSQALSPFGLFSQPNLKALLSSSVMEAPLEWAAVAMDQSG